MNEQKIACPDCGEGIVFDVYALIQGTSFVCTGCDAKIHLSSESKVLVEESINEFTNMKQNVLKQPKQ